MLLLFRCITHFYFSRSHASEPCSVHAQCDANISVIYFITLGKINKHTRANKTQAIGGCAHAMSETGLAAAFVHFAIVGEAREIESVM